MNVVRIFDSNGPTFEELFLAYIDSQIDMIVKNFYDYKKVNTVTSPNQTSVVIEGVDE
jgi:hypothetical protein